MTTNQLLYSLAHAIIDTIDENVELKEEVRKLRKENKEYKDMTYQSVNRPHPAEAMLTLMASGNLSLHKSKDQA